MLLQKNGIDINVNEKPNTNFQIFTPDINIIIRPSISILNEVPKSGCRITKENGINMISKGINKLLILSILLKLIK